MLMMVITAYARFPLVVTPMEVTIVAAGTVGLFLISCTKISLKLTHQGIESNVLVGAGQYPAHREGCQH
jgi:hypothetical protein